MKTATINQDNNYMYGSITLIQSKKGSIMFSQENNDCPGEIVLQKDNIQKLIDTLKEML